MATNNENLKRLVESYLKSSYRTTPVRSPFSQTNYYSGGRVQGNGSWMDLTELYNTTYRTHYEEDGFDKVMYSEPLNLMVAWPKEEAEGFSHIDEDCVATFGLKAARGFKKDYRFLDMSIPGAGKVAVSEENANQIVESPFESLREVRPAYTRNFGETPIERIDESAQKGKRKLQKKLHGVIREEVDKIVSEISRSKSQLSLTESENSKVRRLLRRAQLNENMPRFMDALIDNCAEKLREGAKISDIEQVLIKKIIEKDG